MLRAGCQPLQVPVFELLATLKAEAPGDKKNASFAGFTEVLEGNIGQFREYDSRFYQLLGDPATEASEIHDEVCPDPPGLSNFRSGKLCFVAGREPRSLARAEQLAAQWAEYFCEYRRTGKTQR